MRFGKPVCLMALLSLAGICPAAVRIGLDNVGLHRALFEGKRVGIIANHTSYNSDGKHIVDVFRAMPGIRVTALFSPEHGFRGTEEAGATIETHTDTVTGLPIHSLYGKTNKPTPEMLADVDVLVFDIQDVGARFYTYLYTMSLAMEAAAECGKRFVVLDRPNPINGVQIEGPILEPPFATFVGLYPIPARYGMTVGELARMINAEGWLAGGVKADLTVVPLTGWQRGMWYDQTGLRFIKPSPNMPDLETATLYPGTCLLEGTNLSEGRGTPKPFRQFGAPWIDANALATRLNALAIPGLRFTPSSFTPTSSKHQGQQCHGVEITLVDRNRLEPFWAGVLIVNEVHQMYPGQFEWKASHFDRLCGTDAIRKTITARETLQPLKSAWDSRCIALRKEARKYFLYRGWTSQDGGVSLLEVEQLSLTHETLRMGYRVTNTFPHDIWVCSTQHFVAGEDSLASQETRIADGTLLIRRCGNVEQNCCVQEGAVYAAYHRLPPGQSCSGRVMLPLPVRNQSLAYASPEPFSRVAVNRLVLEVGYFGKDLPTMISQSRERAKLRDQDVAFVRYIIPDKWEGLRHEQSVRVAVSDIVIPGVLGSWLEMAVNGINP